MSAGVGKSAAPRERLSSREALSASAAFRSFKSAGDIGELGAQTLLSAVRPPFSWVGDAIDETNVLIKRCWLPLVVTMFFWTVGFAFTLVTGFTDALGAEDRGAGATVLGFTREVCVWVAGMMFAGVAGAAITADLAARKNREELDAMAVLGVDRTRLLVVPRVVASMIVCAVLGVLAIFVTIASEVLFGPAYMHISSSLINDSISASLISTDLLAAVVKFVLIGMLVSVIACSKGLSAGGGTEGVGKAVNESVVLTFASVWVINSLFNLAYLTIFPTLADFKG